MKCPFLLEIKNVRICTRRSWKILISIKVSISWSCAKRTKRRWRKIQLGRSDRRRGSSFRTYRTCSVRARKGRSSITRRNLHCKARPTFKPQPSPRGTPRSKKSQHPCTLHLLQLSQASNNFSLNLPPPNQKNPWILTSSATLTTTSLNSTTTKRKSLANSSKKQSSINTPPRTNDNSEGQCSCLHPRQKNQTISWSLEPSTLSSWTTSTKRS